MKKAKRRGTKGTIESVKVVKEDGVQKMKLVFKDEKTGKEMPMVCAGDRVIVSNETKSYAVGGHTENLRIGKTMRVGWDGRPRRETKQQIIDSLGDDNRKLAAYNQSLQGELEDRAARLSLRTKEVSRLEAANMRYRRRIETLLRALEVSYLPMEGVGFGETDGSSVGVDRVGPETSVSTIDESKKESGRWSGR